jgi:hypothetical protein
MNANCDETHLLKESVVGFRLYFEARQAFFWK